jgi:hypothetical protein
MQKMRCIPQLHFAYGHAGSIIADVGGFKVFVHET